FAGDIGVAGAVDRYAVTEVEVVTAEIGGVAEGTVRIHLHDEGVRAAAGLELEGVGRRREVGRIDLAGHVGAAVGADGDGAGLFDAGAAEIRRVDEGRVDDEGMIGLVRSDVEGVGRVV